MTDSFSKFVGASFAAHVALILLFTLRALMFPDQMLDLRNAIRVDVVGLPEKTQTLPIEAPTPKAPPAPPPVAQEKPKPVPKPKIQETPKVDLSKKAKPEVAKTQASALDKIKEMAALDKIKNEMSASSKPHPVRGNVVAAGDSLTGTEKIDFDRYFSQIEGKIRQNWSLPQWLVDSHLRAQTLVLIDESGLVKKKQIVRSSGNSEFDSRMLDAIDKSSPFPPPPDRLRDVLGVKGIVFNFPQRGDS